MQTNNGSPYDAFLETLDEDLRQACTEKRWIMDPLPYPYRGASDIERMAKTLVDVLEKRMFDMPWMVPERHRDDVHEARVALAAATLALLPEYFPQSDSSTRSVAVVIGMFKHGWRADFKSAGVLLFEEVTRGVKYSAKKETYVPSEFERHSDGARPYDRLHRDGTHGFTPDDDDTVMFYARYLKIQRRVFKADPEFNFELCVKRPFAQLSIDPRQFYFKEERMEMNLNDKVQVLQDRYAPIIARAKEYDLLDRLMINALLEYLRDTSAPRAARESYVAQAERLIGDETAFPRRNGRGGGHGPERAE